MANETIRAALEAARNAYLQARGDAMQKQAAAVAAFLRAPGINIELMLTVADGIAAAVEAAATERDA